MDRTKLDKMHEDLHHRATEGTEGDGAGIGLTAGAGHFMQWKVVM